MTRITSRPAGLLLALLTSLAAFFVVAPASAPASAAPVVPAQSCSPIYGCPGTTTTTSPIPLPGLPQCIVSRTSGAIGVDVGVTITNVPVGIRVNLLLNGVQVDSAIAVAGGNAVASLDAPGGEPKSARSAASKAAPAQTPVTNVNFDFRVPTGPAGSYSLTAVGQGFACDCFPFTILREVLGGTTTNPGNGGSNLARTGFTVLGLLVLAAVLLVFGRAMVEASRRRHSGSAVS